uniref:Uncharacterized protein n=1 Tax=Mycena chlorophos TaxID=658473 RepID=A0ABQ0LFV3_MYCCL|nr:predicted protein [Mycena chlorophos]
MNRRLRSSTALVAENPARSMLSGLWRSERLREYYPSTLLEEQPTDLPTLGLDPNPRPSSRESSGLRPSVREVRRGNRLSTAVQLPYPTRGPDNNQPLPQQRGGLRPHTLVAFSSLLTRTRLCRAVPSSATTYIPYHPRPPLPKPSQCSAGRFPTILPVRIAQRLHRGIHRSRYDANCGPLIVARCSSLLRAASADEAACMGDDMGERERTNILDVFTTDDSRPQRHLTTLYPQRRWRAPVLLFRRARGLYRRPRRRSSRDLRRVAAVGPPDCAEQRGRTRLGAARVVPSGAQFGHAAVTTAVMAHWLEGTDIGLSVADTDTTISLATVSSRTASMSSPPLPLSFARTWGCLPDSERVSLHLHVAFRVLRYLCLSTCPFIFVPSATILRGLFYPPPTRTLYFIVPFTYLPLPSFRGSFPSPHFPASPTYPPCRCGVLWTICKRLAATSGAQNCRILELCTVFGPCKCPLPSE